MSRVDSTVIEGTVDQQYRKVQLLHGLLGAAFKDGQQSGSHRERSRSRSQSPSRRAYRAPKVPVGAREPKVPVGAREPKVPVGARVPKVPVGARSGRDRSTPFDIKTPADSLQRLLMFKLPAGGFDIPLFHAKEQDLKVDDSTPVACEKHLLCHDGCPKRASCPDYHCGHQRALMMTEICPEQLATGRCRLHYLQHKNFYHLHSADVLLRMSQNNRLPHATTREDAREQPKPARIFGGNSINGSMTKQLDLLRADTSGKARAALLLAYRLEEDGDRTPSDSELITRRCEHRYASERAVGLNMVYEMGVKGTTKEPWSDGHMLFNIRDSFAAPSTEPFVNTELADYPYGHDMLQPFTYWAEKFSTEGFFDSDGFVEYAQYSDMTTLTESQLQHELEMIATTKKDAATHTPTPVSSDTDMEDPSDDEAKQLHEVVDDLRSKLL